MKDLIKHDPELLTGFSATIYKHTFGNPMDEEGETGATPEAKDAFSVKVAREWEKAFNEACTLSTRKCALRTAMVLGRDPNSVFPTLCQIVRLGLGGQMGSGRQYVSWIHEVDFCRAMEWLISRDDLSGPVNVAAPNPVTNREMMRMLREICGHSLGLPATGWMLEVGAFLLRTETELVIKSRRVVPSRLLRNGFSFRFSLIREAFEELVRMEAFGRQGDRPRG